MGIANQGKKCPTQNVFSVHSTTGPQMMIALSVFDFCMHAPLLVNKCSSKHTALTLRMINEHTPGDGTASAKRSLRLPHFLTCTMFPQFPLVLLIWKEIKSSPSMPRHCLSLILTPSLSKPSWKSLHLEMDTSIWAALQVTSASMMSCESVGRVRRTSLSGGVGLAARVGWGPHGCVSLEAGSNLHSEAAILSNYTLITPTEYMNSFEAITWALVEAY